MGPSILFDKSAIQSLGQDALFEVSRYFYTVVPPVLLMETLADLSLKPEDLDSAKKKVAGIAKKVFPIDSIGNADYFSMCVHNLLGEHIPMHRVPAVLGGKPVVAKDGSKGILVDLQPENEAILRWRTGQFNEDDLKFALEWRTVSKSFDLEAMKNALPKPPIRIQSAEQVAQVVDLMLVEPELQQPLLNWFLGLLRCDSEIQEKIRLRWKWGIAKSLRPFAPYACHCLRVQLIFYVGMSHGIFGTRPSNVVDLEYLCYTPFAFVFCSGDKLHQQLAPLILDADQSFVDRDKLKCALVEMAAARIESPNAEPADHSLIRQLWLKHWKTPPQPPGHRQVSEEECKRIMEAMKPILETIRAHKALPGRRFPV